jgi:cytochrome b
MENVLVWDLPTRLFHWLFAVGVLVAAGISLGLGEHSPAFPYHAIIGLTMGLLVCLRLIWGFAGTRYARLRSFAFGPRAVAEYMKSTVVGGGRRFVGHNPGSSVAIFLLFFLILGLSITGIIMGRGNEGGKEVHELLAYGTVAVVVAHVVGVALHSFRYWENLTASMVHGYKQAEQPEGISNTHPWIAVALVVFLVLWGGGLLRNFDAARQTTTLPLLGVELRLGEGEGYASRRDRESRPRRSHDDGD